MPSRDLVGDHQVLLRPVDGRRLVAPAALVVGQGLPLVALDDGRVVIEGRLGPLALSGDPADEGGVDPREALEGRGFRGDVGHGPRGPGRLGCREVGVVVAGVEELAQGVGPGEPTVQEATEARVGLQHPDVVQAGAPRSEQEDQGLDLLGLGIAALPFPDLDRLRDHPVQAQGPQGLHDQGQAGPSRQRVGGRHRFDRIRQQALAHWPGRRPAGPPGCRPRRSARFTAVSASTRAQSSRYVARSVWTRAHSS